MCVRLKIFYFCNFFFKINYGKFEKKLEVVNKISFYWNIISNSNFKTNWKYWPKKKIIIMWFVTSMRNIFKRKNFLLRSNDQICKWKNG